MDGYSDLQLNKIANCINEKFPDSFCFTTNNSGISIRVDNEEIGLLCYYPQSDNLVFFIKKAMGNPKYGTKENFRKIIELRDLIIKKFVAKKFSRRGKIRKFTFCNTYNY